MTNQGESWSEPGPVADDSLNMQKQSPSSFETKMTKWLSVLFWIGLFGVIYYLLISRLNCGPELTGAPGYCILITPLLLEVPFITIFSLMFIIVFLLQGFVSQAPQANKIFIRANLLALAYFVVAIILSFTSKPNFMGYVGIYENPIPHLIYFLPIPFFLLTLLKPIRKFVLPILVIAVILTVFPKYLTNRLNKPIRAYLAQSLTEGEKTAHLEIYSGKLGKLYKFDQQSFYISQTNSTDENYKYSLNIFNEYMIVGSSQHINNVFDRFQMLRKFEGVNPALSKDKVAKFTEFKKDGTDSFKMIDCQGTVTQCTTWEKDEIK